MVERSIKVRKNISLLCNFGYFSALFSTGVSDLLVLWS